MKLTLEQAQKLMERNGGWLDLRGQYGAERFAEFFGQ